MPAVGFKTVKSEMYSVTVLPMYGFAKWNNTEITENLKNAQNANCWPIVVVARQLPAVKAETFMLQTRSVGRR